MSDVGQEEQQDGEPCLCEPTVPEEEREVEDGDVKGLPTRLRGGETV